MTSQWNVTNTERRGSEAEGADARRLADLALADHCWLNVLWLHDALPCGAALEVEVPGFPLGAALRSVCGDVHQIPLASVLQAPSKLRRSIPDRSFDLITSYGYAPGQPWLVEFRRLLRPGGLALLAAEHRWWAGRLRGRGSDPGTSQAQGSVARSAAEAGFVESHLYWVEPSLHKPRNLIPARARPIRDFEAMRAREWGASVTRTTAVRLGLAPVLYPALLLVARA